MFRIYYYQINAIIADVLSDIKEAIAKEPVGELETIYDLGRKRVVLVVKDSFTLIQV